MGVRADLAMAAAEKADSAQRLLIFRAPARGQGVGNMLQGLASALFLSELYGRQLCVWWKLFEAAFEPRDVERCPSKASFYEAGAGTGTGVLAVDAWVELWNFGESSTEALWRSTLSGDARTVVMQGNLVVDGIASAQLGNAFDARFTPTEAFLSLIREAPSVSPRIVAHLRVADDDSLARGLFADSGAWDALRRWLPHDTFVVSDSSRAYTELADFAKPRWAAPPHTATVRTLRSSSEHILRTWADWWVIRQVPPSPQGSLLVPSLYLSA